MAKTSRFGANHELDSWPVQFEMPVSCSSGNVKKVAEVGGFHGEASGLRMEIWEFLLVWRGYLKSWGGWDHFSSAPDPEKELVWWRWSMDFGDYGGITET